MRSLSLFVNVFLSNLYTMKIYKVGGAVRDQLLQRPVTEIDWVVVGATAQQLLDQGYIQVGKDFPVFLHPKSKEEYALARTERKTSQGYTGFTCDISTHITLEEDLLRRDLTINAMALDQDGNLVDPYNGQFDLQNRWLRHVSDAFTEDPLRVLRVARFAARYYYLGFRVALETMQLMRQIVLTGELESLPSERIVTEFEKSLGEKNPEIFISILLQCGALEKLCPEIHALFGVSQNRAHHPEVDTGLHTLLTLQMAVQLSDDTSVRFAALTHDLGKGNTPTDILPQHIGHEQRSVDLLIDFNQRLAFPNKHMQLAKLVAAQHTNVHRAQELKAKTILGLLEKTDAYRQPQRFELLLTCCEADSRGRHQFSDRLYPQKKYLLGILNATLAIPTKPFIEAGIKGKEIGEAIQQERLSIIKKYKQQFFWDTEPTQP